MAALDEDFSFVAASVSRTTAGLRAACNLILNDETLSGAHALAGHLDLAYAAIENRVASRQVDFQAALDDTVREDAIVEMRRLTWSVRDLQANLSWLDSASEPPLDLGTTYYVDRVARSLVRPDVQVTLVAADNLSYATTSNPYERFIAQWGTGTAPDAPTVVVVFVPRREQHSGLLHPLIIHELGHAADSAHGLVDVIWEQAQQRANLSRRFSATARVFATDEGLDPHDATDHIAERLRAWITECLCDAIAVHQLGPTYLYSFIAEVAAGNIDDPGPRHPPPRQRIAQLLTQLDRIGWTDFMRSADPSLMQWIGHLTADGSAPRGMVGFLSWAVNDLRAVIRRSAERLLQGRVFQPNEDELAEVSSLLAAKIPPAQRRNSAAVSPESIMLCCWHTALANAGGGPAALAAAADSEELSDVLPSALELSALVDAWNADDTT